ncbi:MAG: AmmeMemoRadiSam system protein B [Limnohabitans sp.]|nr:AmmeMemoRadiSam system protein B [Limnohabitans sp.]
MSKNSHTTTSSPVTSWVQQAFAAWQGGQREQALALLQQAHAQAPDDAGIEANLARVELGLGHVEAARHRAARLALKQPDGQALEQALVQAYLAMARPAALAGRFYPGDAAQLARDVDAALLQAEQAHQAAGSVAQDATHAPSWAAGAAPKVLVLPHAGHVYSGGMAARGYALLRTHVARIRKIVMLGPTHRMAVPGVALPGVGSFATPLGAVEVDSLAAHAVADMPCVLSVPQAHAQEHCLEVHLPFIQRLWAGQEMPRVLPLLVGAVSPQEVALLLDRLWGGDDTLIIISTDLSHFHTYEQARHMDLATCAQVLSMSGDVNHQQACGATPLNAALLQARTRALQVRQLGYCNSGDTAGNTPEGRQRVVGYASFALYEPPTPSDAAGLDAQAGARLLQLARHSLHQATAAAPVPAPAVQDLSTMGASFVTLTQSGQLRGCIGSLQAHRPLHEDVLANAQAAALKDPRFAPVTAQEAPHLAVEVSVLTKPEPLHFANESHALWQLQPHVHGVIFSCEHEGRAYRSTFLPQVWAQLPDPRKFMAQLKRKAGLPYDHWSASVHLSVYRVQKFSEADHAA